jgi:hypothetical protein
VTEIVFLKFQCQKVTVISTVTVDVLNVGLALPHGCPPDDIWIKGLAENCQEYCELRYHHFERLTAIPL